MVLYILYVKTLKRRVFLVASYFTDDSSAKANAPDAPSINLGFAYGTTPMLDAASSDASVVCSNSKS